MERDGKGWKGIERAGMEWKGMGWKSVERDGWMGVMGKEEMNK